MDDQNVALIVATIAAVTAAAAAYVKVLGPMQVYLVEAIIDATSISTRYKRLLNVAIGVSLAVAVTFVTILQGAPWWFVGVGIFGGLAASIEAAKAHDAGKSENNPAQ